MTARSLAHPHKCRVLLVEDDEAMCTMCASVVRMEGFFVRTATDGVTALRLAETFEPDVVITDLKLPMASGFELLHELHAVRRSVPVIAVSGHERGLMLARENPEFFATLQKPFDPEDLIGITRRAAFGTP